MSFQELYSRMEAAEKRLDALETWRPVAGEKPDLKGELGGPVILDPPGVETEGSTISSEHSQLETEKSMLQDAPPDPQEDGV